MKKVVLIIAIVLLVLYLIAGYFIVGLPVASKIMGSNNPVDFGVEISVDSAYQGLDALGQPTTVEELQEIVDNPGSLGTVQTTLTEEEASSRPSFSGPGGNQIVLSVIIESKKYSKTFNVNAVSPAG